MTISIRSEARKGPRKSRLPLNLKDRQTDGRMDISIYRVASLLQKTTTWMVELRASISKYHFRN